MEIQIGVLALNHVWVRVGARVGRAKCRCSMGWLPGFGSRQVAGLLVVSGWSRVGWKVGAEGRGSSDGKIELLILRRKKRNAKGEYID